MSKLENTFDLQQAIKLPAADAGPIRFELFTGPGFDAFEATAITQTLSLANQVAARTLFEWRFVSDKPGLVTGSNGMLVRADPAVDNYNLSEVMIVVGGTSARAANWMTRARQMQRKALTIVLLSDAATAYIRATHMPTGQVTTHWRDAAQLQETGYHPTLTQTLSERSDGIITAAGSGATAELVIGLIAPLLDAPQVAELGNLLLLPLIRKSNAEQPKDIADNPGLFGPHVTLAIKLMEASISDPVPMAELTQQVGVSTRHLERIFRTVFDQSPARFYKRLRTKRARAMIEETLVPLIDVAMAAGFGSADAMCKAVKDEYGLTPSKMRARTDVSLLKFA
ncbi:helix-turn-helix domain-containing protein [Litoreibacter sp.]|nr:helix-turn-helix domain-containing protein [Litoreibacter sp.]